VSAVGAAVYGHSLHATRRQVTKALRLVRPAGTTPATPARSTGDGGRPARQWPDPTTTRRRSSPRPFSRPRRSHAGPAAR
jgi:hypothetical protein